MVTYFKLLVILIVVGVVFISSPAQAESEFCVSKNITKKDASKKVHITNKKTNKASTKHSRQHARKKHSTSGIKNVSTTPSNTFPSSQLAIGDIDENNKAIQARVRYEERMAELRSEREAELLLLNAERNGQTTVNYLK